MNDHNPLADYVHSTASASSSRYVGKRRSNPWGNITVTNKHAEQSKESNSKNLIDWNVDLLMTSLQQVVIMRQHLEKNRRKLRRGSLDATNMDLLIRAPFEEVTEIIELPKFNTRLAQSTRGAELLDDDIRDQMWEYVKAIASRYRENAFHNIDHASHVTMSANKLMNRIVVPDDIDYEQGDTKRKEDLVKFAESVHNSTFGISSDPIAQFAIVFSALVHDVDHTGLTNAQLVKEGADVALLYKDLSVAEQNSITAAWSLLMEPQFDRLRQMIFATPTEQKRFRQLVVNAVMATDIVDTELQRLRKNRWDKAFHGNSVEAETEEDMDRKATIVIEHIIQASDVAHTMQHWRIFTKWNEKLFQERYVAYLKGHEKEDPSIAWYSEELNFFDYYVIPLANKLKECGVFGVSSDEYLGFAVENRIEWEMKGKEVVGAMLLHAQINKG